MKTKTYSVKSLILVAGLTVLVLLPFINKAFHIDDTLFLWCAKQIQAHPFDFFGFDANWNGLERPMYLINQNPPLVSYYIALIGSLFGFSEIILHAAFLIPAIGISTGIYCLALLFSPAPAIAAFIAVATPAFIVSATNVMCDILMVAFYVWAVVLWAYGVERDKTGYLFISSLLIGLSALTKYFGITLVPLLFAYTLMQKHSFDRRILFLIIPVIILAGYQWLTLSLYNTSLLSNAAEYALERGVAGSTDSLIGKTFVGMSFCGGCLLGVLFLSHLLWSRLFLITATVLSVCFTTTFILLNGLSENPLIIPGHDPVWVIIQFFIFVLAGVLAFCLAVTDVVKHKDAKSMLLFLWMTGTFIFSSHVNWTINARTMLPMIPAVGILLARRLGVRFDLSETKNVRRLVGPLLTGVLLALAVAWGDASFAGCQRTVSQAIRSAFTGYPYKVWFQGHWGFQYYMQDYGLFPLDFKNSIIGIGDIIVIPKTNTGQLVLPPDKFTFVKKVECRPIKWVATMSKKNSAGFYSDTGGKLFLPFVFNETGPEEYYMFIVGKFKHPQEFIRLHNGRI